ncbi:KamA family radical SAM protein [Profundibacter sp.]
MERNCDDNTSQQLGENFGYPPPQFQGSPGARTKCRHVPTNLSAPITSNLFPLSTGADRFRQKFYPDATIEDWNDHRWQMRARIRTAEELQRIFVLGKDEKAALEFKYGGLPVGITPYYASLMSPDDPSEPLRRTHIPVSGEHSRMPGEADDPLSEDRDTTVPGLVHRYPDRVLFLTTPTCNTYCRFCTRSRLVGQPGGEVRPSTRQWEGALAYISKHREIRDVLLSGGDPLTLADEKLDWLLGRLQAIPHVEFVRIGTKAPVVLPMRITPKLIAVLSRHQPLWLSLHITHPTELTPEATEALARLADAGIPLGSQTVLLKDINDDVGTMKTLMHGLLKCRVRPYYIYQCDPIAGSAHFRTPVSKGLEIIEGLRGHTTGYAVPTFVIDAPGGGGKIPLSSNLVVGHDGKDLILKNYEGAIFRYPDPHGSEG